MGTTLKAATPLHPGGLDALGALARKAAPALHSWPANKVAILARMPTRTHSNLPDQDRQPTQERQQGRQLAFFKKPICTHTFREERQGRHGCIEGKEV